MEVKIRKGNPVLSLISLNCTTSTILQEKELKTFPYISIFKYGNNEKLKGYKAK